jgi:prolyl-tRNA editing enzyme YbaK/EbsC (Cys-tRNA(Pro) deacylase)
MTSKSDYHPVVNKILNLLDAEGSDYKCFEHEAVRTSEEAARVRPGYTLAQGAKALIVRVKPRNAGEKYFAQIIVPGDAKFNTTKLKNALDAKDIRFASEDEVGTLTGGIEPGGVPPFGNLFGLSVCVDASLLAHDEIVFNAGDRRFSIALKTEDYLRVVEPEVVAVV